MGWIVIILITVTSLWLEVKQEIKCLNLWKTNHAFMSFYRVMVLVWREMKDHFIDIQICHYYKLEWGFLMARSVSCNFHKICFLTHNCLKNHPYHYNNISIQYIQWLLCGEGDLEINLFWSQMQSLSISLQIPNNTIHTMNKHFRNFHRSTFLWTNASVTTHCRAKVLFAPTDSWGFN